MLMQAEKRAARLLRRQGEAFDRLARRMARRLTADGVHQLRVLVRRIRASIWLARSETARPAKRVLRRLGRALGARRVLDVAASDGRSYGLNASSLVAEQDRTGREVTRLLRPARRAKLLSRLRDAARAPARDGVSATLAQRAERLESALSRAPRGAHEMHELRIELKKVRYILEALGRNAAFIKPLQDRLGRLHDLDVMQQMLGKHERAERDRRTADRASRRTMKRVVARAVGELRT